VELFEWSLSSVGLFTAALDYSRLFGSIYQWNVDNKAGGGDHQPLESCGQDRSGISLNLFSCSVWIWNFGRISSDATQMMTINVILRPWNEKLFGIWFFRCRTKFSFASACKLGNNAPARNLLSQCLCVCNVHWFVNKSLWLSRDTTVTHSRLKTAIARGRFLPPFVETRNKCFSDFCNMSATATSSDYHDCVELELLSANDNRLLFIS